MKLKTLLSNRLHEYIPVKAGEDIFWRYTADLFKVYVHDYALKKKIEKIKGVGLGNIYFDSRCRTKKGKPKRSWDFKVPNKRAVTVYRILNGESKKKAKTVSSDK